MLAEIDRRAQPVEVVQFLGRDRFPHFDQVGELRQLPVAATHEDRGQVGRLLAVLLLELHHHVVLLALLLEAGHLPPAQQRLQRPADFLHVGADGGDLVALEHHRQLRLVQAQVGIHVRHARILPGLGQDLIDQVLQFRIAAALDHELHRRIAEALAQRRRIDRKRQHAGQPAEHLRGQFLGNVLLLALALLPGFQPDKRQGAVDRIGLLQPRRDEGEVRDHFGNGLVNLLQLPGIAIGVFQRRPFRRDHHADDGAAILQRRQFRFEMQEQPGRAGAGDQKHRDHQPAPVQGPDQRRRDSRDSSPRKSAR